MFLIKPYFKYLCQNSYDSTCNEYYKYINTLNENSEKYKEKFADNLIQQFDDFSKKMHGLSLSKSQADEINNIIRESGAEYIDDSRFEDITNFIKSKLKNLSQSQKHSQLEKLDKDITKFTR